MENQQKTYSCCKTRLWPTSFTTERTKTFTWNFWDNITPGIARAMNLTQIREGFLVLDIIAGGPADKAGITGGDKIASINGTEIRLGGDVITKIDNQTIRKLDDMLNYLRTKEVGDVAHLQVLRDGKLMNIAITLGTNRGLSNPTEWSVVGQLFIEKQTTMTWSLNLP
jgi:predicted metalloprotease with PDZ domain